MNNMKINEILSKLKKPKLYLGGTCNNSTWRDDLISQLKIEYFNPVVKDWTPDCQAEELKQREICDYCLYTITSKMTGVYSIAEVVDDSNKRPTKTLFCVLSKDGSSEFSEGQLKSLDAVKKLVSSNGVKVFNSLTEIAEYVNGSE